MRLFVLGPLMSIMFLGGAYGQSSTPDILNSTTYTSTCEWEPFSLNMCILAVMSANGAPTDEAMKISVERRQQALSKKQCVQTDFLIAMSVGAAAGVKTIKALQSGTLPVDPEKIRAYCLQAGYEYEFQRCPGAGPTHCPK
jgi:hypothetical protein